MSDKLRRLGVGSSPTLHVHFVVLDAEGNGTTTEEAYHVHEVVSGKVLPAAGHTHSLPETFIESAHDVAPASVALVAPGAEIDLREARVDAAERVIHDVVVLGESSINSGQLKGKPYRGRRYTPQAQADAVGLLEGARAYADHAMPDELAARRGNRSIRDFLGTYRNVRVDESAHKVRADLHVVKGSDGDRLLDIAERMPESLGISLDANGYGYVGDDDILCIESLTAIHSGDVVDKPATTSHLFESFDARGHYARARLSGSATPNPEGPMTGTKTTNNAGGETALREQLDAETAKRKAAEAEATKLREADEARTKVAETQAAVARVLESRPNVPPTIAARLRVRFAESVADETAIRKELDDELAHAAALLSEHQVESPFELAPLEESRGTGGKGGKPAGDDGEGAFRLAESVIAGACGVRPEKTENKDG